MENPKPDELGTDEGKETPEKTPIEPVIDSDEIEALKKQRAESAKEAIRLAKENKAKEAEIQRLKTELEGYQSSGETPLDENELARKHPDWDILGESEKSRIRQAEHIELRQKKLDSDLKKERAERIKAEEERRFNEGFQKSLVSFPDLKGKEQEFKDFCYNDKNLGNTNFEILAKSFLFDSVKEKEADRERKEREGLEPGTGGEKKAPAKEGFTAKEAHDLMVSNPKKYNEMVRDGKIKIV